jgi:hypothetical protein
MAGIKIDDDTAAAVSAKHMGMTINPRIEVISPHGNTSYANLMKQSSINKLDVKNVGEMNVQDYLSKAKDPKVISAIKAWINKGSMNKEAYGIGDYDERSNKTYVYERSPLDNPLWFSRGDHKNNIKLLKWMESNKNPKVKYTLNKNKYTDDGELSIADLLKLHGNNPEELSNYIFDHTESSGSKFHSPFDWKKLDKHMNKEAILGEFYKRAGEILNKSLIDAVGAVKPENSESVLKRLAQIKEPFMTPTIPQIVNLKLNPFVSRTGLIANSRQWKNNAQPQFAADMTNLQAKPEAGVAEILAGLLNPTTLNKEWTNIAVRQPINVGFSNAVMRALSPTPGAVASQK